MTTEQFDIYSKKYGTATVIIDASDAKLVGKYKWVLHKAGQFLYVRSYGLKRIYLHRLVTKAQPGKVVDHINRDPFDNRKSNLRVVSIQENLRNQKRANNKTGITGVSIGHNGKYNAQIKHNYKKVHLGTFSTIEKAEQARKAAERRLQWQI